MAITYNSDDDLIEVVDGTEETPCTFEDIYQADVDGGWGKVTKLGDTHYLIDCDIHFGNHEDEWYFKDTNKEVTITGQAKNYWAGAGNTATFMLGEKINGFPVNGCIFRILDQTEFYPYDGTHCGNLLLYASVVSIDRLIRHYGTEGEISEVINCHFTKGEGFRQGGEESIFSGNVMYNLDTYAYTTISPTPKINDLKSYNSQYGLYYNADISHDALITNASLLNNDYSVYVYNNSYYNMKLIDCTSDLWNLKWSDDLEKSTVARCSTYIALVTDMNNVSIEGPSFAIFDKYFTKEVKKTTGYVIDIDSLEDGFSKTGWYTTTDEGGDQEWTHNEGGTPSSGTGPDSAFDGTYYAYCETSGEGNPDKAFEIFYDTNKAKRINLSVMINSDKESSHDTKANIEIFQWKDDAWDSVYFYDTYVTDASWSNTGDISLDSTNRIMIRGTSATGDDTWSGDMAIDLIEVEYYVDEITGVTPIYGHYIASNTNIFEHGIHTLRIRKYGYTPLEANKEFIQKAFEKSALRIDTSITQTEDDAKSYDTIKVIKSLANWNLTLPIDPSYEDVSLWSNDDISITHYNSNTPSPLPSHFDLKCWSLVVTSQGTKSSYYLIDVSAESANIDDNKFHFDWSIYSTITDKDVGHGKIKLIFLDSDDSEISNITFDADTGSMVKYESSDDVPSGTRTLKIEAELTTDDDTDVYFYFSRPELKLNNDNDSGYSITIDCDNNDLDDVFHYLQWGISQYSSFNGIDGIEWHNMLLRDGTKFQTINGTYKFGIEDTLTCGVELVNFGAGNISRMQKDNGDYYVPPVQHTLTIDNLIENSEVRIYRKDDMTELGGIEDSSDAFNYNYEWDEDIPIIVVIFNIAYTPIRLETVLKDSDSTLPITQLRDRNYNNPE